MTVQTLAAELGIDIADVGVAVRWLTAGEVLDDAALELELRGIFDQGDSAPPATGPRVPSAAGCRGRTSCCKAGIPAAVAGTPPPTARPTPAAADTPATSPN